jgi:hypothetical protein
VTPVDFLDGERTTRIQVECEGNWHIELRPLESLAIVEAGATRAHRGDDVFAVRSPDTATITGNGESRYFGVRAYVAEDSPAGLVNTTDPYQGEVILPRDDVVIIEVTAVGDWIYTNNAT